MIGDGGIGLCLEVAGDAVKRRGVRQQMADSPAVQEL